MSTVDHTGQGVSGTVNSSLAVRIEIGASCNLRLHPHEHILIDDGFMAAFHIVLRSLSIVDTALLVQNADRECLLKKGIADVLFIGQDLLNVALMPFLMTCTVLDAISFQASFDLQKAGPVQILPVDAADDFSLYWVNDQVAVSVLGVAQEPVVVDLHLALLIAELDAHADIGR